MCVRIRYIDSSPVRHKLLGRLMCLCFEVVFDICLFVS